MEEEEGLRGGCGFQFAGEREEVARGFGHDLGGS